MPAAIRVITKYQRLLDVDSSGVDEGSIFYYDPVSEKFVTSENLRFFVGEEELFSGFGIHAAGDIRSDESLVLTETSSIFFGGNCSISSPDSGELVLDSVIGDFTSLSLGLQTNQFPRLVRSGSGLLLTDGAGEDFADLSVRLLSAENLELSGQDPDSVLFIDASGSVVGDTTKIFYDSTSARMGVNNSSPETQFDIGTGEVKAGAYYLGGVTSAFPAVKFLGTTVRIELGDGSNFADLQVRVLSLNGSAVGSATNGPLINASGTFAPTSSTNLINVSPSITQQRTISLINMAPTIAPVNVSSTENLVGIAQQFGPSGSNHWTSVFGVSSLIFNTSTGGMDQLRGASFGVSNFAAAPVTAMSALRVTVVNTQSGATIASAYGLEIANWSVVGSPTVTAGISIDNTLPTGSGGYAIRSLSEAPSLLVGSLIIGSSGASVGSSGAGVLVLADSAVPGSSPADQVQLYSADFAAGDARLFVRDESGVASAVALLGKAQDFTAVQGVSVSSANAFYVGPNGNTNPVLRVVTNTASQATGLSITGAASGSPTRVDAIGSAASVNLTLSPKVDGNNGGVVRLEIGSAGINIDRFGFAQTLRITFAGQDGPRLGAILNDITKPEYSVTSDADTGLTFISSNTLDIGTGGVSRIRIDPSGNIGIGQTAFGTSSAKVLAISTGTAPSSSPADAVQLYSADFAAGDARLFIRSETGDLVGIGNGAITVNGIKVLGAQQAFIADPSGGIIQDTEARTTIEAILDAMIAHGLIAAS